MGRLIRRAKTLFTHSKLLVVNTISSEKIAVCVPIRNRTHNLINHIIGSLNKCVFKDRIILSVYDCGSDDIDNLEDEIRKRWKGELVFTTEQVPFSKTYALNKAIKQSPTDRIFCCDADMTLPKMLVLMYDACVGPGVTWFPIYFSLYKDKPRRISPTNGWWRNEGFGLMGVLRPDMEIIGGFDESFTKWGDEDTEIAERTLSNGLKMFRYNCWGLYHNWHPYGDWGGRDEEIFQHI